MKGRFTAPARIALLTVFSVAFLFVFVFPTGSYLAQRNQVNRASHDLAVLRKQNFALSSEAEKLQTSAEIERIARERYNMALPGEQLFLDLPGADDHDDHCAPGLVDASRGSVATPPVQSPACPPPPTSPGSRNCSGAHHRGAFEVVTRAADGGPQVIRNEPLLDDGTPMPTRYWLVDRDLVRRISRVEADRGVRAAEAAIDPERLRQVHATYAAERDAALPVAHEGPRPHGGVGGTRTGVKCLHAHYAYFLAGGDDPVGEWVAQRLSEGRSSESEVPR